MFNLRSVDLNLLPVFEAVHEERSISRAADRLAMTQSAVSHAANRLRHAFGDALFVREPGGIVPTAVANLLYPRVHAILQQTRSAVTETRGFDPQTSEREFVIALSHPLGPLIAVRCGHRMESAAPRMRLSFATRSRPEDLARALRESRVDIAIDWIAPRGRGFRSEALFDDWVVAVARRGHAKAKERHSTRALQAGRFVHLHRGMDEEHTVPGLRTWQEQLPTHAALEVSEVVETFIVVRESNLYGLAPRSMLGMAKRVFGLEEIALAAKPGTHRVALWWHASRQDDRAHALVRRELQAAVDDVLAHEWPEGAKDTLAHDAGALHAPKRH